MVRNDYDYPEGRADNSTYIDNSTCTNNNICIDSMPYSRRDACTDRTDTEDDSDCINGIVCRSWGDSIAGGGG